MPIYPVSLKLPVSNAKKCSGVPRMELFYAHPGKILETMPRIVSKMGATLKGKNLLPEGANSFL